MAPPEDERPRSRSPTQRGFRWKKKPAPRYRDDENADESSNRRYRNRSPQRDRYRDRDRDDRYSGSRPYRNRDYDSSRSAPRSNDTRDKRDGRDGGSKEDKDKAFKEKAEAPKKTQAPSEPLLIVHVNDRLGSKTAVPCLGSDKIGQLKALVAAQIGRPVSSIVLRRQGERPFKDMLTLDDYGISSGVQLDLEIDTGD